MNPPVSASTCTLRRDCPRNVNLSKVALAWMVKQADLAGVNMKAESITVVANPVLHDKNLEYLTVH